MTRVTTGKGKDLLSYICTGHSGEEINLVNIVGQKVFFYLDLVGRIKIFRCNTEGPGKLEGAKDELKTGRRPLLTEKGLERWLLMPHA